MMVGWGAIWLSAVHRYVPHLTGRGKAKPLSSVKWAAGWPRTAFR
ncbi:hypothetical protein CGRA01v4_13254 [Colletotrichum graminicola]|nr:hypothetical protein CGRA01v4_13254 [Colletotrichum graminicola]